MRGSERDYVIPACVVKGTCGKRIIIHGDSDGATADRLKIQSTQFSDGFAPRACFWTENHYLLRRRARRRESTHRGARTHDHKVKSLALCRLSWAGLETVRNLAQNMLLMFLAILLQQMAAPRRGIGTPPHDPAFDTVWPSATKLWLVIYSACTNHVAQSFDRHHASKICLDSRLLHGRKTNEQGGLAGRRLSHSDKVSCIDIPKH